ncbi:MAG: hypothetical protein RIC19_05375 [Phaeodactylibacter sp.]|uniref:hypothetical protein n=1 Tax=Phaeodactylibacter sp. TaxID=1940289 RepID=UPI0032EB7A90
MKKIKFLLSAMNKTWSAHLFNFIVVLFSVILAFWLNNRAVEKSLTEKKQNLLTILKESLESDKASLDELITFNLSRADSLALLRDKLGSNEDIEAEQCLQLSTYNFFAVDKSAFELIKYSDIVSIIKNSNLLFTVSSVYYTYDEDIETLQEEYTLAFQRVIEPVLIKNFNMVNQEIDFDTRERIQFINRIYVLEDNLQNIIFGYKQGRDKIDIALKEIAIELNE